MCQRKRGVPSPKPPIAYWRQTTGPAASSAPQDDRSRSTRMFRLILFMASCGEPPVLGQLATTDLPLGDEFQPGPMKVKLDCAACSHTALLSSEFLARLGLESHRKILDLKDRVQCRRCGRRGRAMVSIKWAKPSG
jgi:hypothetical protein